jgi:hypothetical protein
VQQLFLGRQGMSLPGGLSPLAHRPIIVDRTIFRRGATDSAECPDSWGVRQTEKWEYPC